MSRADLERIVTERLALIRAQRTRDQRACVYAYRMAEIDPTWRARQGSVQHLYHEATGCPQWRRSTIFEPMLRIEFPPRRYR
jgi:hypothetical protein